MRIEIGGVYKDGNGDKIGPMTRSATGGDTPWYCRNNGLYRDDGSFIHNDPHGNDIVGEWVDDKVGTLVELGVKSGDVVECVSSPYIHIATSGYRATVNAYGKIDSECGNWSGDDGVACEDATFRIISRADNEQKSSERFGKGIVTQEYADIYKAAISRNPAYHTTPKTWGEMTDADNDDGYSIVKVNECIVEDK